MVHAAEKQLIANRSGTAGQSHVEPPCGYWFGRCEHYEGYALCKVIVVIALPQAHRYCASRKTFRPDV